MNNNIAAPTRPVGSDFARLSRRIAALGLLDRRPGYYAARLCVVITLFYAGWTGLFLLGDSWWSLAIAAFLAVMFGQVALVSHDLAHRQVFRTRRPTQLLGRLTGNFYVGMSYGWWMDKHVRHHAHPNHEGLDPDVEPDILVWSQHQAGQSRGLPRVIGKHQAALFFPLLTLEGWNLHVSSIRAVLTTPMKQRWFEGLLLLSHFVLYFGIPFVVLSPGKAVIFIVLHQALWGIYMGSIFAPNHKGMQMFRGDRAPDFCRRQILTTRNVRGNWFIDRAFGGLNYQIEHHLFPSMPSPQLRKARPVVQEFCAEIGLPYQETGLFESYRQVLRHLRDAGTPLRTAG